MFLVNIYIRDYIDVIYYVNMDFIWVLLDRNLEK